MLLASNRDTIDNLRDLILGNNSQSSPDPPLITGAYEPLAPTKTK
jgi:hypothetical protein